MPLKWTKSMPASEARSTNPSPPAAATGDGRRRARTNGRSATRSFTVGC
jgi:hypothetical protein